MIAFSVKNRLLNEEHSGYKKRRWRQLINGGENRGGEGRGEGLEKAARNGDRWVGGFIKANGDGVDGRGQNVRKHAVGEACGEVLGGFLCVWW